MYSILNYRYLKSKVRFITSIDIITNMTKLQSVNLETTEKLLFYSVLNNNLILHL